MKESKCKRLGKMMCKQNNFILLQNYCDYFFKGGLFANIMTIKILNIIELEIKFFIIKIN